MSIFYKSTSRDENALSYRFLAIYQKLSREGRSVLFKNCGLGNLPKMEEPISIQNQAQLGKRQPDGIIKFPNTIIVFENKVNSVHEDGFEDDLSQLKYYYSQVNEEFRLKKEFKPKLLIAANSADQTKEQIRVLIREQDIPEDDVDIMTWQEVHNACIRTLRLWDTTTASELDRFLVNELKILLEDMDMESFSGIKIEHIEGYAKSYHALSALQEFLKSEIIKEFSMLKPRTMGHYGSIHQRYLAFRFLPKWRYARLFVAILRKDQFLKTAITLNNYQSTSALMKPGILEELIPALETIEGFRVRLGPDKKTVNLSKRFEEYKSGNFFEGYLSIDKRYTFQELKNDFGLDSIKFPENLMSEILKLKPIATIIYQGLMKTKQKQEPGGD